MDKIKARLHSLSKDRRYMFFVGIAIIIIGLIGLASSGFAAFLAVLLGAFCLLVGYYGGDLKKGLEEFKHDMMEAKDAASAAAQKTAEVAKSTTATVSEKKPVASAKKPVGKK